MSEYSDSVDSVAALPNHSVPSGMSEHSDSVVISQNHAVTSVMLNHPCIVAEESKTQGPFHVLAEPGTGEGESFDIVAISNISGGWKTTWTDSSTNHFWLRDTLPQISPRSRVLSYECSDISGNVVGRHPDGVITDLLAIRHEHGRSKIPLILIAFKDAGYMIKDLFISSSPSRTSRSDFHDLHNCIRGFVFFGTAHAKSVLVNSRPGRQEGFHEFARKSLDKATYINAEFEELSGEDIPNICFYTAEPWRIVLPKFLDSNPTRQFISAGIKPDVLGHITHSKKQFTLESKNSQKTPIDAKDDDIAKFASGNDKNLIRVKYELRMLLQRAQPPAPPIVRVPVRRLLCLDGGGVRGLFSILILERLMEEVHRLRNRPGPIPRPCEYFDLIGGTSTGGLLAIMLGRLQMDLKSCKADYCRLAKSIFAKKGLRYPGKKWIDAARGKPWFPAEPLENAFRRVIAERIGHAEQKGLSQHQTATEDAPLIFEDPGMARSFVCTVTNNGPKCILFRSYSIDATVDDPVVSIWQAARATCAAPLYFPSIEIHGQHYFDGAIQSNNPILELKAEADRLYGPKAPIAAIVSIGTGKSVDRKLSKHLIDVMKAFSARLTNTEAKHDEFMSFYPELKDRYFRFQGPDVLGKIDLAASGKLVEIRKLAEAYLESQECQDAIKKCAAELHRGEVANNM